MKPTQATKLLAHAFRNRLKVLLVSAPGVGKSALVELAARQAEADLVVMHPAVSDPTDFKGMPTVVREGETSLAEFLPFGNLRQLVEADSLTVCFIDDIGQAPHAVQAALMQLIHAREVDGQKISEHVVFTGATNDASHMAGVSSILEPVKSRWDSIVHLHPEVECWVKWAVGTDRIPPEVVAFVRFRGDQALHDFTPTRDLANSPSPRTVEAASRWIASGVEDREVLTGAIGEGWTQDFLAFLKIYRSMPDLDEVIANPDTAPLPGSDASLAIAVTTALAYRAGKDNFDAIIRYLARISKEFEVFGVRDATNRDQSLFDTKAYTQWAVNNAEVFA